MNMLALILLCALQSDLPKAPEGVQVREVVQVGGGDLPSRPARCRPDPKTGMLYLVYTNGDVWQIDPDKGSKKPVLEGKSYAPGNISVLGLHVDAEGRFYVVANENIDKEVPKRAHVVAYRFAGIGADGVPAKPSEWVTFDHPWGIGPFNHGANHLATGPDGMIYLSVGSRTDHGETGKDPKLDTHGETPLTACMLKLDPKSDKPKLDVFCRGLRNSFGFDWDDQGRLVATENGPDADHPEELNWLREGKHYGFPHEFGNHAKPMYPDAVPAPEGLTFEKPIANLGPAGKAVEGKEYSYHPHSSPSGVVFYRKGTLPAKYDNSFIIARFGNFLGKTPVGFDLLHTKLVEKDGELAAEMTVILEGLRRPIDLCQSKGKLYLLEHTTYDEKRPARLLEVSGTTK